MTLASWPVLALRANNNTSTTQAGSHSYIQIMNLADDKLFAEQLQCKNDASAQYVKTVVKM